MRQMAEKKAIEWSQREPEGEGRRPNPELPRSDPRMKGVMCGMGNSGGPIGLFLGGDKISVEEL